MKKKALMWKYVPEKLRRHVTDYYWDDSRGEKGCYVIEFDDCVTHWITGPDGYATAEGETIREIRADLAMCKLKD